MPDVARAVARCYAAGLPFAVALERAADVVPDSVAGLLRRAAEIAHAGHAPGDALAPFDGARGARALVAAFDLHAELGGDLSSALRSVADHLAAERSMDGEARVATAQARFAARVVPTLPIAALSLEGITDPHMLAPLVQTSPGRLIVVASGGLIAGALVAMGRIARGIS